MARSRKRRKNDDRIPGHIWLLGGFTLGLVAALAIYLTLSPPPTSETAAGARPRAAAPIPAAVAEITERAPTAAIVEDEPTIAAEDETEPTATSETEFEFYDVLPAFEVVVPDAEDDFREDPRTVARARSGNYIIQAGAFATEGDADRMQARLALLGFESRIQRVSVDDSDYLRVRIGPVEDLAELNRIRRRLREERIDYLLIDSPN